MRRRRIALAAASALLLAATAFYVRGGAQPSPRLSAVLPPIPGAATDLASVHVDSADGVIELRVGPVLLPGDNPGYRTPIQVVRLPAGGALHGYAWEITDAAGRRLPDDLLHHVNLIDPDQRDLFSPVARRVLAAGRETAAQSFTSLLGYPLAAGSRLLIVAMFSNPLPQAQEVVLRLRLQVTPVDGRIDPVPIFPFGLDVMGPVGEKSFPVPPGRTERSWEGSPAVDGRVLVLGGHMHDHARMLRFEDVTSGRVLWEARPVVKDGRLEAVPLGMPWKKGGIALRRSHRYRLTVVYENPGKEGAVHGGMGVLAGIVHTREAWPALDRRDPAYVADLASVLTAPHRGSEHGGHAHAH